MLKSIISSMPIIVLAALFFSNCSQEVPGNGTDNILLKEWSGPYGGVPAFDKMDVGLLTEAMETAMATHLGEIEEITNSKEPPDFENTILAKDRSGQDLDRVDTYYSIFGRNLSSEAFRAVAEELEPKLSAHRSKIIQNEKLFKAPDRRSTKSCAINV
jgi:peptidyl-dipeptidase Dcp